MMLGRGAIRLETGKKLIKNQPSQNAAIRARLYMIHPIVESNSKPNAENKTGKLNKERYAGDKYKMF